MYTSVIVYRRNGPAITFVDFDVVTLTERTGFEPLVRQEEILDALQQGVYSESLGSSISDVDNIEVDRPLVGKYCARGHEFHSCSN